MQESTVMRKQPWPFLAHGLESQVWRNSRVLQIFNVKQAFYRLIVHFRFKSQRIFIREFLTHKEYDLGDWKERNSKAPGNIFEGGIPDTYEKLCLARLPRPIHYPVDYDNTMEIIDALTGLDLNADQEDYLQILASQIEEYEGVLVPAAAKSSGLQMLRTACEETKTSQVALARILNVSQALVSLILGGRRPITVEHAKKLSRHFGVKAALFLDLALINK